MDGSLKTISSARAAYKAYDWSDLPRDFLITTTLEELGSVKSRIIRMFKILCVVLPAFERYGGERVYGGAIELIPPEGLPVNGDVPVIRFLYQIVRHSKTNYDDFILYVVTPLDMDDTLGTYRDVWISSTNRAESLDGLEVELARDLQSYYEISLEKVLEYLEDLISY